MRTTLSLLIITALLGVFATSASATTRYLNVGDNWFVRKGAPTTVTVKRGTTVVWRFRGRSPHNVVVASGPVRFRSPARVRGTYGKRMTRPGTYRIYCSIHRGRQHMRLRVRR